MGKLMAKITNLLFKSQGSLKVTCYKCHGTWIMPENNVDKEIIALMAPDSKCTISCTKCHDEAEAKDPQAIVNWIIEERYWGSFDETELVRIN